MQEGYVFKLAWFENKLICIHVNLCNVIIYAACFFFFLIEQLGPGKSSDSTSLGDIEDIIYKFLVIMLERSMRQKDGWKVYLHYIRLLPDHAIVYFLIFLY